MPALPAIQALIPSSLQLHEINLPVPGLNTQLRLAPEARRFIRPIQSHTQSVLPSYNPQSMKFAELPEL